MELRSEALKDRHWRPLLRRLGVRVGYHELNLGLLWGSALMGNKKVIGETVLSAQGEMALEEFLRQARLFRLPFLLIYCQTLASSGSCFSRLGGYSGTVGDNSTPAT